MFYALLWTALFCIVVFYSSYPDRTDNSFSRSHSSSTTSLENVNKEAIECLVFADAYARKSGASPYVTQWCSVVLVIHWYGMKYYGSVTLGNWSFVAHLCQQCYLEASAWKWNDLAGLEHNIRNPSARQPFRRFYKGLPLVTLLVIHSNS